MSNFYLSVQPFPPYFLFVGPYPDPQITDWLRIQSGLA